MKKLMAAVILAIVVSALVSCAYVASDIVSTQSANVKTSALANRATATAQPETVTITGTWHVRSCPDIDCSVVGYVYDGYTLELLATDNGWLELSNGSVTGWINGGCCDK